jgi:hypothetical protein
LFVFYSASDAKQGKYLLPLYPALAVMLGVLFAELPVARGAVARRTGDTVHSGAWVRAPALVLAVAVALCGAALAVAGTALRAGWLAPPRAAAEVVPPLSAPAIAAGLLVLPAGIALVASARRARWDRWLAGVVVLVAAGAVAFQVVVAPVVDRSKSARELCRTLAEHAPPQAPLAIFGIGARQHGDWIYYSGRTTVSLPVPDDDDARGWSEAVARLTEYVARPEAVFVLAKENVFHHTLEPALRDRVHEISGGRKGSRTYVLFTNRPVAGEGGR